MLKKIRRVFLYLFLSSLLYVLITKLVEPPITITQITNAFGLGLQRDYISWKDMSYNIKLAAIASEDQSFTDHMGFDWDAIEKSLHPKKKNKKYHIKPINIKNDHENRVVLEKYVLPYRRK